jgi:DNA-binding MarR family transcriptional regulator
MDPLKRLETDRELSLLLTGWEILRTHHRELPAQAVTVLLYVASHNPCHKQAIEEDQKLTTASCSRMVDLLCDGHGRKGVSTKGLGLITKTTDPSNRRRHLLSLTPKGESLVKLFKDIIYG